MQGFMLKPNNIGSLLLKMEFSKWDILVACFRLRNFTKKMTRKQGVRYQIYPYLNIHINSIDTIDSMWTYKPDNTLKVM